MFIRRPGWRLPALMLALIAPAACAVPEEDIPADSERLDEGGSDPTIDAEDAEGLPEEDLFEPDEAPDEVTRYTLATATSEEYGEYLVDGDGLALYVSVTDPPNESTCTGTCVQQWPILAVADEDPEYAEGVEEDLVGTFERDDFDDEVEQVTYREKPLYYHRLDQQPGMTTGQGTDDRWFLISPDGVELRGED